MKHGILKQMSKRFFPYGEEFGQYSYQALTYDIYEFEFDGVPICFYSLIKTEEFKGDIKSGFEEVQSSTEGGSYFTFVGKTFNEIIDKVISPSNGEITWIKTLI